MQLGFVNQVTPAESLLSEATRWAEDIMACSPMSIRASKAIVRDGAAEPGLATAYERQR